MEESGAEAATDSRDQGAAAGKKAETPHPEAVGEDPQGAGEEERKKGRKVWKKVGRPNKYVPPEEQTAVFGESPKIRRQRFPKQVERVINKQLDKPIAGPAAIALLDTRGKIITTLDVREMASSVLRHFGGYDGLGKLLRTQHDESKPGSPTRTKTLELVTKLIAKGAEAEGDGDISKQSVKQLGQRAAVLVEVVRRLGGERLLIEALRQEGVSPDGRE